jgi:hypothetical protein
VSIEADHRWWKYEGASQLREILLADWDPIGVNGIPEARDEYDGYLGAVANRLRDGANAREVAEYLADVQSDRMGLPATPEQLDRVAERIVRWYQEASPA